MPQPAYWGPPYLKAEVDLLNPFDPPNEVSQTYFSMTEVEGTSCPQSSPSPEPGSQAAQLCSHTILDVQHGCTVDEEVRVSIVHPPGPHDTIGQAPS